MATARIDALVDADVSGFVSGMGQATGAAQRFAQTTVGGFGELTKTVKGIEGAVGKMRSSLTRGFAAIGAGMIVPSIFSAAKSALIDFNQQLDQSRIAFTTFMGSADKANSMLLKLQDFAARTPFNFKDLLGTTQQMIAMGTAADDLIPRLTAIGDAAAALGGSPEVMRRIQRALGQIQAKGRVQAEELMQLAEVGIPAYQYIADILGVTIPQSLKMMERGQVSAATAITGLLDGMGRDFGGMMKKHSETMMGALSTVQDYVSITVANMTRPLFESVRGLMVSLGNLLSTNEMKQRAADFAESVRNAFVTAGQAAKQIWEQIGPTIQSLVQMVVPIGRALANGLKSAMPVAKGIVGAILAVAKAVKPVIDGITTLIKKFGESKVVGMAVATGLLVKFTPLGGMIKKISEEIIKLTQQGAVGDTFKVFKEGQKGLQDMGETAKRTANDTKIAFIEMAGGLVETDKQIDDSGKKMRLWAATEQATSKMAEQAFAKFGAATKAVFTSLKASALAFVATIPLLLAITTITNLISGLGKKSREASARLKEVNDAIKAQVDLLLSDTEALQKAADRGVSAFKLIGDAILETGEDGAKLAKSFGDLGQAFDLRTLIRMRDNFVEVASGMLKARGASDELAKSIAETVNASDDPGLTALAEVFQEQGDLTAEQAEQFASMGLSLEEIQDQIEKLDLTKLVDGQVEMLVASGKVTIGMMAEATALAQLQSGYNQMSEDEQTLVWLGRVLELVAEQEIALAKAKAMYEEYAASRQAAMLQEAVETADLVTVYNKLKAEQTDGTLSLEEFTAAVFGASNATKSYVRMLKESNDEINGLVDGLKDGSGEFEDLQSAVMSLDDQMISLMFTSIELGKDTAEIAGQLNVLASRFIQGAEAAGYTEDEVRYLLSSLEAMGRFQEMGINIYANVDQAIAQVDLLLRAIEGLAQAGIAPVGLIQQLAVARKIVDTMQAAARGGGRSRGGGGGGATKPEEPENPFAWVAQWLADVTAFGQQYGSQEFAEAMVGGTAQEIGDKIAALLEDAQKLALTGFAGSGQFLAKIRSLGDQMVAVAQERERLTARLNEANAGLANAISMRDQLAKSTADSIRNSAKIQLGTPENIMAQLNVMIGNARQFKSVIRSLASQGYPKFLIDQVIAGGPIEGTQLGLALLEATEGQVAQFRTIGSELEDIATTTGAMAGDIMYGDIVQGFVDEIGVLTPAINDLTDTLADLIYQIQTNLAGAISAVGATATQPTQVTINAGAGTDPYELGRVVVTALQSYQRRTGSIPITVSG